MGSEMCIRDSVPSADPRTLQLHLREFPFSPPSTPLLPESMYTHARSKTAARAHYPSPYEAASSWTREAGGASKAIVTVPAMRPRALLGASCESNGSKEKTLKSGAVGSRALAGQRLKQADFTFQDPSRGFGTTTHVPSADPRTLQLHLRDFPFSPPPPPPLPESITHTRARRRQRAYTVLRCSYPRSRLYFLDLYSKT